MYGDHELHDSYYHHTCLIIPEQDVLEADISGTGFASRIARWWTDLFLLSYTSGRSTGFYNSTHAMRIERFKHFRKYKSRIHPMSKFRNFWDCLILHVFIINKILFRFTSTFIYDDLSIGLFYLGAFLELIIIVDLYVTLKTGYINHETKRVVLDAERCLVNFCKTKLFIHYVSAIPLHWFLLLKYGSNVSCGLCKANKFVSVLKIISIFSLYRVCETSSYWIQRGRLTNRSYIFKFIRIGAIGIVTLCQFYDLSDVVILCVFMNNGFVERNSMLGLRTAYKYSKMLDKRMHNFGFVLYDMNRIFKALILFSHGIRERTYYLDRLTSLMGYVLSNLFYFWTLMECLYWVHRLMYPKDSIMRLKTRAMTMISCRQLSDDLSYKVLQYLDFKPTKFKVVEKTNELWKTLPEELKKEAKLCCYLRIIMRIPFFCDLSLPLLEQITMLLEEKIFLRNDIVAEALEQAEGLMIIDNGVLAVYSETQKEQGHLIDGDHFGGLSLVTDKELCMSLVVAITASKILLLQKNQFRMLMREHPQQFSQIKALLKKTYSNRTENLITSRRASDLSDLPAERYPHPSLRKLLQNTDS
ncbi:potassium/sodium hyperpolarization-activated cyclic nucleotide-gated channel 1 [Helicoverpa armigera]|uniref:potassium/sodium hyperpolarization-activated cyclic nucleotide-gated channel 1 n=1 Tax=Helicoverpa armigera TaxID=29058 RepID=UPI000B3829D3|nr:potassium/sodium hyperpolarization-activated cyclic nucleotide-gated channel 1 [Helicoverpa armigera]